jgi:PAS domain S-box-containing protein
LRQRALSQTSPRGRAKLLEQLRVCRLDLEMQKEQLRCVQLDLEGSRDRFAALYDFAPVGYLTLDPSGSILQANLTAAKLMGLDGPRLVGHTIWHLVAADSKDAFYLHLHNLFSTQAPQTSELRLLRPTGEIWDAQIDSAAVKSGETGRLQCLMTLSDITRLKWTHSALRRSEQSLADFFAAAPVGLLWVAPDGRIQRANQAQAAMLGRRPEDLFGRHFAEFCANPEVIIASLARLARKESVQEKLLRFQRRDRSVLRALADANGLWEDGKLVHSRWFVRDVTRQMELQTEVLAIGERVQQRIGQDLHDDLCQQLTSIEFLSRALERQLEGSFRAANSRAREIASLTRRLIDHTRQLSHGMLLMDMKNGTLPDALRELAARTKKLLHIDCRFRCDSPAPLVDSAQIHLYRIAQEAINNAVKHGKARRIRIELKATKNQTVLGVENDGVGLPPEPSRTSGFGLRIMEYRARSLGGSLVIQNRGRRGVCLQCAIPNDSLKTPSKAANGH